MVLAGTKCISSSVTGTWNLTRRGPCLVWNDSTTSRGCPLSGIGVYDSAWRDALHLATGLSIEVLITDGGANVFAKDSRGQAPHFGAEGVKVSWRLIEVERTSKRSRQTWLKARR